jgi:hypothetical protein
MPLAETENSCLDHSESYTISGLNPPLPVDTENANLVFKAKTLALSFINLLLVLL